MAAGHVSTLPSPLHRRLQCPCLCAWSPKKIHTSTASRRIRALPSKGRDGKAADQKRGPRVRQPKVPGYASDCVALYSSTTQQRLTTIHYSTNVQGQWVGHFPSTQSRFENIQQIQVNAAVDTDSNQALVCQYTLRVYQGSCLRAMGWPVWLQHV